MTISCKTSLAEHSETSSSVGPSNTVDAPLAGAGRPVITASDFRDGMASLATTVCIVSAAEEGERLGRTATAVFSLSNEPPSLLVSINTTSELAAMIARRRSFSVAMLARPQWTIANAFAGGMKPAHRFKCGVWNAWPSHNPRLEGAVTAVDCDLIGQINTGNHTLFAGAIVEMTRNRDNHKPLIWYNRGYHSPQ